MKPRRHSLSIRLLLLFLVTAALLTVIVRTGFRYGVDRGFRELASPHLQEYVAHLLDELGTPPDAVRAGALADRLPLEIHLLGPDAWSSGGAPPDLDGYREVRRSLAEGSPVALLRGRRGWVVRAERDGVTVLLVPDRPRAGEQAPLAAVLTIAAVLAVLALAYHLIGRLFRPVQVLRDGVARIGAGDVGHRVDVRRRDELGQLAESINRMASDIQGMLEAKRALLLGISHELRSPLTRARLNAELAPVGEARDALLADLSELQALLDELLESERLQGRHVVLERQAVDPSVLLGALVQDTFPDAGVELDMDPPGTWIPVDPVRTRLMVRNLLHNALRHTPEGAPPPVLSSRVGEAHWRFSVRDHGPGIAREHLDRLAEPFYRADPARGRESGGVGLGLYLARVIAEAHGGTLRIESEEGSGTRVSVSLPLEAG